MPSFSASLFIWLSAMKSACGAPKPRNAARHVVGVHGARIALDVGDFVRAALVIVVLPSTFVGGVAHGAAVGDAPRSSAAASQPSRVCPQLGADDHIACRLWRPMMHSAARPDDLDRAFQFPGRQRQHDLHRHIFAPAERAADGRVDCTRTCSARQAQRVRDLLAGQRAPTARPLPNGHAGRIRPCIRQASASGRMIAACSCAPARGRSASDDDIRTRANAPGP